MCCIFGWFSSTLVQSVDSQRDSIQLWRWERKPCSYSKWYKCNVFFSLQTSRMEVQSKYCLKVNALYISTFGFLIVLSYSLIHKNWGFHIITLMSLTEAGGTWIFSFQTAFPHVLTNTPNTISMFRKESTHNWKKIKHAQEQVPEAPHKSEVAERKWSRCFNPLLISSCSFFLTVPTRYQVGGQCQATVQSKEPRSINNLSSGRLRFLCSSHWRTINSKVQQNRVLW